MKEVSLESASGNLKNLFLEAGDGDGIKIIDTDGQELGVLLSDSQFKSTQIRLDLASNPNRLVEIMNARQHFQSGELDYFDDYKFG